MPKREVLVPLALLVDVLEGIRHTHTVGKCFFACRGPDSPPRQMTTVHACWEGWRIRCLLIRHGHPIHRSVARES